MEEIIRLTLDDFLRWIEVDKPVESIDWEGIQKAVLTLYNDRRKFVEIHYNKGEHFERITLNMRNGGSLILEYYKDNGTVLIKDRKNGSPILKLKLGEKPYVCERANEEFLKYISVILEKNIE